jgi:hypothetical protein
LQANKSVSKVDLTTIDVNLKQINAKYAHKLSAHKTTAVSTTTLVVAGADLATAVQLASATWGWCATGWGGLAAGFVTVFGSAAVSYLAYKGCGSPVWHETPTEIQNVKYKIISDVGTYTVADPYANPYENRGLEHNAWVKVLCQKSTDLSLTTSSLVYASSDLTAAQQDEFANDATTHYAYDLANSFTPSMIVNANGNADFSSMLSTYFANDNVLYGIMSDFFDGYVATDDASVIALINDYENYFINTNTGISDQQKAALLSGFAVGKHSYTMWSDAFSTN